MSCDYAIDSYKLQWSNCRPTRDRSVHHRQCLAVLMASAVVVLKHETSTLRQSHNCISIDVKFGVGDYVRDFNSPAKLDKDPWLPENQCSRTIAQRTWSGVRKTLFGMRGVWLWNLGVPLNGSEMAITSQNKISNNFETVRVTPNMSMNHDYETGLLFQIPSRKPV